MYGVRQPVDRLVEPENVALECSTSNRNPSVSFGAACAVGGVTGALLNRLMQSVEIAF
jgi:hypothetical protein